jgi:hypothetical protein
LSSEKQRIRGKIREIDAELKPREDAVKDYEGRLHDYNRGIVEEIVEGFEVDLLDDLSLREYSLQELFSRFQELRFRKPNELEQEVIREIFPTISQEIRDELTHRRRSSPGLLGSNMFTEPRHFRMPQSEEVSQREERDAHEWEKKLDDERARIDILSELRKNYEQELK